MEGSYILYSMLSSICIKNSSDVELVGHMERIIGHYLP